jgi:hypothetical protein
MRRGVNGSGVNGSGVERSGAKRSGVKRSGVKRRPWTCSLVRRTCRARACPARQRAGAAAPSRRPPDAGHAPGRSRAPETGATRPQTLSPKPPARARIPRPFACRARWALTRYACSALTGSERPAPSGAWSPVQSLPRSSARTAKGVRVGGERRACRRAARESASRARCVPCVRIVMGVRVRVYGLASSAQCRARARETLKCHARRSGYQDSACGFSGSCGSSADSIDVRRARAASSCPEKRQVTGSGVRRQASTSAHSPAGRKES